MQKRFKTISLILALLLCFGVVLTARVEAGTLDTTGEATLTASNPTETFEDWVPGLNHDNVIAFDYWYTPDPIFTMHNPATAIVTQTYCLTGPGDQMGAHPELVVYHPSTAWATAVLNTPGGLWDIQMTQYNLFGPPYPYWDMTDGAIVDNATLQLLPSDYVVNNQLMVKNVRGYASYDDYLASISNGSSTGGSSDGNSSGDGSSGSSCGGDHSGDGPAPEPATMMMMATGLLGLAGFEMKRRQALKK